MSRVVTSYELMGRVVAPYELTADPMVKDALLPEHITTK
jgi:hypothetical protein